MEEFYTKTNINQYFLKSLPILKFDLMFLDSQYICLILNLKKDLLNRFYVLVLSKRKSFKLNSSATYYQNAEDSIIPGRLGTVSPAEAVRGLI